MMRVIIAMMLYTVQSAVHAVDQGGGNFTEVVYVNDSVVLNSYVRVVPYRMSIHQEIEFRVDEKQFSGFLVTFANKMDVHRESCVILDGLLVLQVNERNISFGCSHYIVHFFHAPLRFKFVPSVYASLSEHVTITITAIRFSCPPFHPSLRQCPNQPLFCISRHLFCDGQDNCGVFEGKSDESECRKNLDHISIAIVDKRTHLEQYILTGFGISSLFLSITLLMIAYQWHSAKRKTNHNQYVKNIFGDRVKQRDSTDPEETVALLAIGLRNFLPRMAPAPPCPPVQLRSMSYSRVGL